MLFTQYCVHRTPEPRLAARSILSYDEYSIPKRCLAAQSIAGGGARELDVDLVDEGGGLALLAPGCAE